MLKHGKASFTLNIIANNSLITPLVGMSGGDRIFVELVRYFSKLKVAINLFSGRNVEEFISENKIAEVNFNLFSEQRFSVYKGLARNYLLKVYLGIKAVLEYNQKNDDDSVIYSASDFWPDVLPAVVLKLKSRNSFWIASFYQLAPKPWQKDSPYVGIGWFKGFAYWFMQLPVYWLIRKYADAVFLTSFPDISLFPKHKLENNFFVVQGGVDLAPSIEYARSKKETKKYYDACFIGRLHPQKGVMQLIDIWQLVVNKKSSARLAIIGNGPLKEDLINKIKKLDLELNIDLLGFKDGGEKYKIFKQSKMILHPAIYDSGGMAAAEAMAWGLPGISFDLESLKTYYPKGMIKVKIGDLEEFSNVIIRLMEDNVLQRKAGMEARQLIETQWGWEKRINEIYSFVLKRIS